MIEPLTMEQIAHIAAKEIAAAISKVNDSHQNETWVVWPADITIKKDGAEKTFLFVKAFSGEL